MISWGLLWLRSPRCHLARVPLPVVETSRLRVSGTPFSTRSGCCLQNDEATRAMASWLCGSPLSSSLYTSRSLTPHFSATSSTAVLSITEESFSVSGGNSQRRPPRPGETRMTGQPAPAALAWGDPHDRPASAGRLTLNHSCLRMSSTVARFSGSTLSTDLSSRPLGHVAGDEVVARFDLPKQRVHVLVIEGQRAAQQGEQDDAGRPDVHLRPDVQLAGDYLRGGVVRAAAAGAQELAIGHDVGEAEVRDLHIQIGVQQQVLRLEVAVHDHVLVAVVHPGYDLLEEAARLLLAQVMPLNNVVKQLATAHVLHHQEDLDDVWVPEGLHILNFTPQLGGHIQTLDLAPIDNLHSNLMASHVVHAQLHLAKGCPHSPSELMGRQLRNPITMRTRIGSGIWYVPAAGLPLKRQSFSCRKAQIPPSFNQDPAHAPVFKAAATLCNAVSLSMKSLAETHPAGSSAAQFIDRFLLREICAHLEAQHRVLRNALDSLESQGRARASAGTGETPELAAAAAAANCQGVVLPYTRLMSAPSSMQVQDSMPQSQADSAGRLQQEVQKLQRLVDRMEANTSFFTGRSEEAVMEEEEPVILVVRRRVTVQDEQLSRLRAALKKYAAELEGRVPQCLFLSVRVYRETGGLVIYEFWESLGSWRKFLPSPVSKELRKCIVDCSEAPESTETLLLPFIPGHSSTIPRPPATDLALWLCRIAIDMPKAVKAKTGRASDLGLGERGRPADAARRRRRPPIPLAPGDQRLPLKWCRSGGPVGLACSAVLLTDGGEEISSSGVPEVPGEQRDALGPANVGENRVWPEGTAARDCLQFRVSCHLRRCSESAQRLTRELITEAGMGAPGPGPNSAPAEPALASRSARSLPRKPAWPGIHLSSTWLPSASPLSWVLQSRTDLELAVLRQRARRAAWLSDVTVDFRVAPAVTRLVSRLNGDLIPLAQEKGGWDRVREDVEPATLLESLEAEVRVRDKRPLLKGPHFLEGHPSIQKTPGSALDFVESVEVALDAQAASPHEAGVTDRGADDGSVNPPQLPGGLLYEDQARKLLLCRAHQVDRRRHAVLGVDLQTPGSRWHHCRSDVAAARSSSSSSALTGFGSGSPVSMGSSSAKGPRLAGRQLAQCPGAASRLGRRVRLQSALPRGVGPSWDVPTLPGRTGAPRRPGDLSPQLGDFGGTDCLSCTLVQAAPLGAARRASVASALSSALSFARAAVLPGRAVCFGSLSRGLRLGPGRLRIPPALLTATGRVGLVGADAQLPKADVDEAAVWITPHPGVRQPQDGCEASAVALLGQQLKEPPTRVSITGPNEKARVPRRIRMNVQRRALQSLLPQEAINGTSHLLQLIGRQARVLSQDDNRRLPLCRISVGGPGVSGAFFRWAVHPPGCIGLPILGRGFRGLEALFRHRPRLGSFRCRGPLAPGTGLASALLGPPRLVKSTAGSSRGGAAFLSSWSSRCLLGGTAQSWLHGSRRGVPDGSRWYGRGVHGPSRGRRHCVIHSRFVTSARRQAEAWGRSGWSAGPSCSVIFRWEETGSSSRPKELDEPWDAVGLANLVNGRVASEEAVPGEVAMAGKGHDKGSNILPILVQKDVSEPRSAWGRSLRLAMALWGWIRMPASARRRAVLAASLRTKMSSGGMLRKALRPSGVLRLTSESPGFLDEDEPRLVELGVTHKVDRGCDAVLQINLQAMDSLVADHYHAVGESLSRSSSSFSVVGDPQTSMGVSASSAVRVAVESSADVSPAWTLPSPLLRASVLSLPVPSASSVRSMRVAPASWFLAWSSARWIRPDLRVLLAGLRLRFPVSAARTALPGIGSAVCLGFFAGGAWAPVPVSEALAFLASSAFRSSQRRMTRKRWVFCRSPSLAKTSLPSFLGQFSFGRSSRRLRLLSSELHQMKMQPSVLADLTTLTGRPARSWSMSAASMVRQALSSSSAVPLPPVAGPQYPVVAVAARCGVGCGCVGLQRRARLRVRACHQPSRRQAHLPPVGGAGARVTGRSCRGPGFSGGRSIKSGITVKEASAKPAITAMLRQPSIPTPPNALLAPESSSRGTDKLRAFSIKTTASGGADRPHNIWLVKKVEGCGNLQEATGRDFEPPVS
uniref:ABM domain-containing protein n=1 Tax=Macrostomum lignano TaxID=282301 RepID=A0A1I8I6A6_9PLAT